MRLDKISKNKTISTCKSNKIIIKIKKTYNNNFRINLPINKPKNTFNSLLTKISLESKGTFKTINHDENDNEMRHSIIRKKSSHKSPIQIKRATLYNSETIKSVKNYMKGPLKGKEIFCTVYSGLSVNGEIVTIKEYNNLTETQKKTILENRENIYKLNHPNIIKVISLSNKYDEDFKIVYESLNVKNVEQHIKEFGTFNERMIKKYGKQLLKGLEYMHNKKVYHKNLNPTNILVDVDGIIKISGLTNLLNRKVDVVEGKTLSSNDYTDEDKAKLDNIDIGAQRNVIEHIFLNDNEITPTTVQTLPKSIDLQVKEFDDEAQTKLSSIESGAQVNTIERVIYDGVELTADDNKTITISPDPHSEYENKVETLIINGTTYYPNANKEINVTIDQAALNLNVLEGAQVPDGRGGRKEVEQISKKIQLESIAVTGDVKDLRQTAETYITLDCGSSTEVI